MIPTEYAENVRNLKALKPTSGHCKSCKAKILWAVHPQFRNWHPFNPDGTTHFSTCPDAKKWRKRGGVPEEQMDFEFMKGESQ